jgi:hypothetical protein
MPLILLDSQKVLLGVEPLNRAGNPAPIEGKPAWSSSDESVLTVVVSEDGLSAYAITTGKLGTAQISAKADADLGEGVREITAVWDVEVKPGDAVLLNPKAGTPEEK